MRKWSRDNLDLQGQAFSLKGPLSNSGASTFICNYSGEDDISVEDVTSTNADSVPSPSAPSPSAPSPPVSSPSVSLPLVSSIMQHLFSKVYRDQLLSRTQGIALWDPNPRNGFYDKVSIGDVGYLHEGSFIRMFNVMLPWDHPSNRTLGNPKYYQPLDDGPFTNTLRCQFGRVEQYSRSVSVDTRQPRPDG